MMSERDTSHIHVGKDGWLFVTAGSNNVLGQFGLSRRMRKRIRDWKRAVLERMRRCERLGIRYVHVIVPEKLTVYDNKLDGIRVSITRSPALRLRRSLIWHPRARRACPDLVNLFRKHREDADLFIRTDSHWSLEGRLLAYREICHACAATPREDFADRPYTDDEHTGDLGEAFDPPRTHVSRFYAVERDSSRVFASPIVRAREAAGEAPTLHVGSHVIYRNETDAADPRRMVLFGDSYAHFAPIMLMIMLAETFREVHFIWSSSIDWGYVERVKPDILVAQLAERFMHQPPDDSFDLEAYVQERYGPEIQAAGLS